ncbi:MAG TPA: cyclic nucleotide-binding domain-containing protein [Acidobacteriota bacterium]|jgi:CRP-like cAMP-binding protein
MKPSAERISLGLRGIGIRVWLAFALVLTLLGLLSGLQFVLRTTGGTLFLFATFAPLLIFTAILIVSSAILYELLRQRRLFEYERYGPGEIIFRQGDSGDCAYFIRSGEVEVVHEGDGAESVIAKLGKGEYFGEMALLSNEPRNATVRAVSHTELATLGKRNFLPLLNVLPAAHEDILKTVRRRAMAKTK